MRKYWQMRIWIFSVAMDSDKTAAYILKFTTHNKRLTAGKYFIGVF